MKSKMLFSISVLLLGAFALRAQEEMVVYETKVETKKVPSVIVEHIKKDYPGLTTIGTYLVPAKLYEQKWMVVQKNEPTFPVETYEVEMKGKDMTYVAVYTPKGVLLNSREVFKKAAVPPAVAETIRNHYPGWIEQRDKEVIRNGKKEITHFIFFLKKGWREERVVLDPQGKILHRFEL